MSSHRENLAWKQAELDHARAGTKADAERLALQRRVAASSSSSKGKGKGKAKIIRSGTADDEEEGEGEDGEVTTAGGRGRRLAPFYKIMTGMPIAVDAFRYGKIPGVEAYLLSHFHSDHYTNLGEKWKNGMIYCSRASLRSFSSLCEVGEELMRDIGIE